MKKLQRMIDDCAKKATQFHNAQAKLMEYCIATYGAEPGDVDADLIIDAVLGGCGACEGMPAAEFDAVMREATGQEAALGRGGPNDNKESA